MEHGGVREPAVRNFGEGELEVARYRFGAGEDCTGHNQVVTKSQFRAVVSGTVMDLDASEMVVLTEDSSEECR